MNFNYRNSIGIAVVCMLCISSASAAATNQFSLGIVIRQGVLKKLAQIVNSTAEPLNLRYCMSSVPQLGKWTVDAEFSGQLSNSDSNSNWTSTNNGAVLLETQLQNLSIKGTLYRGCDYETLRDGSTGDLVISPERRFTGFEVKQPDDNSSIPISVWFDPANFLAKANYISVVAAASIAQIKVEDLGVFSSALNGEDLKISIFTWLSELGGRAFGIWLKEQFRGMSYVENLGDLLREHRNRSELVQFEQGALKITHSKGILDQLELALAVYPRRLNSLFLSPKGIEFYFNALILNHEDLNQMNLPLSNDRSDNFQTRVSALKQWLGSDLATEDTTFTRPQLPENQSDFSMFMTEPLVNHIMDRLYREDLLSFRTTVDLGESTQGLLIKELADVKMRLDLGSRRAPHLKFQADRLNLQVSDYILSLGTEIEDRIIPATHIQCSVNLAADLTFDSATRSITLVMDPNSFSINLQELHGNRKQKLEKEDLKLLEGLAKSFWEKYFQSYPKLALFRPVFQTDRATIRPLDLKVQDGMILMDFEIVPGAASK